jgi:predicted dehydrogenase
MKTLRVGIVGAGFAARYHTECLRRVYGVQVEIAGVTSRRRESREAFASAHGTRAFDDVAAMLDQIDVLDVCSPPYAHEAGILAAVEAGKGVFCEKPLTGCFGPPDAGEAWRGDRAPKEPMLAEVVERLARIRDAVRRRGVVFGYGENFVYAPSVQKEREIIEKTGAQVLRLTGEESHNGSASPVYGIWRYAGGGSLVGKGVHPLGGILYLKRIEGLARDGRPIRPRSVSARVHQLTRLPGYQDRQLLRTDYHDIEDYGVMHVVFEDGTVADIMTGEVVLGGIYDFIEVFANNHRTRCHLSPVHLVDTYNPRAEQYRDIYLVEKCSTQEGWSPAAPDENFTMGYQAELQDFITCAATGSRPQSDLELALDATATTYAAYVSAERRGCETEVPRL